MRKFGSANFAILLLLLALIGWDSAICNADSLSPRVDSLPGANTTTIQCVRDNNCLLVPVEINAHTSLMLFDTGADDITMSLSQLSEFGLNLPDITNDGLIQGVGEGHVKTWKMTAGARVGALRRPECTLNIQPVSRMHPVLGFNFFKNYMVNVDQRNAKLTLIPDHINGRATERGAMKMVSESTTVKVKRAGSQFLLPVEVNGNLVPMLFDTGADGITFNKQQADEASLIIPPGAVTEVHQGVGGTVRGVGFDVAEITMGPIVKRNVKISVIESPGMPYPLMGSEFFQDCSYTIDEEHSQILFEQK